MNPCEDKAGNKIAYITMLLMRKPYMKISWWSPDHVFHTTDIRLDEKGNMIEETLTGSREDLPDIVKDRFEEMAEFWRIFLRKSK